MCWLSDFFSSCPWFERVIRQTSTNSAHCYSQLVCSALNSFLLSQPGFGDPFFRSFTKAKWALTTLSGDLFSFCSVRVISSIISQISQSSFSDFLCTWDRQYCTVPQATDWSRRTQELLRLTAELLAREQKPGMLRTNPWESDNVSETPLISWAVTKY